MFACPYNRQFKAYCLDFPDKPTPRVSLLFSALLDLAPKKAHGLRKMSTQKSADDLHRETARVTRGGDVNMVAEPAAHPTIQTGARAVVIVFRDFCPTAVGAVRWTPCPVNRR